MFLVLKTASILWLGVGQEQPAVLKNLSKPTLRQCKANFGLDRLSSSLKNSGTYVRLWFSNSIVIGHHNPPVGASEFSS